MPTKPLKKNAGGNAVKRYHSLLRLRTTGRASQNELAELQELILEFEEEPGPPEFEAAMVAVANDRRALLESVERIETLLKQSRPGETSGPGPAASVPIHATGTQTPRGRLGRKTA